MSDLYEIGDVLKEDANPARLCLIVDKAVIAGDMVYAVVRTSPTGYVSRPSLITSVEGLSRDKSAWGADTLEERLEDHRQGLFDQRAEALDEAARLADEIGSLNVYIGRMNEKEKDAA